MQRQILFLAANPVSTERLRLDEEVRGISEGLSRAKHRDDFVLNQRWALRPDDLRRAMLDLEPEIVHFSGHGAGEQGIVLEDNTGRPFSVSGDALKDFFSLFPSVQCVVLNACYSDLQANAIVESVKYVIGMTRQIGDMAAIQFAVSFYDALGAGKPVDFAYRLGCNSIKMMGIRENLTPVLLKHRHLRYVEPSSDKTLENSESSTPVLVTSLRVNGENANSVQASDAQSQDEHAPHASILDGYEITNTISETSLSRVWRVKKIANGNTYILKQNKHPQTHHAELIQRLRSVYENSKAKAHVALPLEIIQLEDTVYELLDAINGWTLEEIIRLNPHNTIFGQLLEDWSKELLDLLIPLHQAGFVHRDINPYNILVTSTTLDLVLIDFSNAVYSQQKQKPTLIETPGFSAPELREGRFDPSSDLYSVGAVLAYLNTGQHPPTIEDRQYRARTVSLHDLRGRRLESAIHKMLSLAPDGRFKDADEARGAIQRRGSTEVLTHSPEGQLLLGDGSKLIINKFSWRRT